MNTIFVGYDLNSPGQNYDDLIKVLESYGTRWHALDSTWLLRTSKTAIQVRDELKAYLDSGDELLVMNVTGDGRAWHGFSEKASKWLKDNF